MSTVLDSDVGNFLMESSFPYLIKSFAISNVTTLYRRLSFFFLFLLKKSSKLDY
jgi:hypothetical protein